MASNKRVFKMKIGKNLDYYSVRKAYNLLEEGMSLIIIAEFEASNGLRLPVGHKISVYDFEMHEINIFDDEDEGN